MGTTTSAASLSGRITAALPAVTPGVVLRAYQAGQLLHDIRVGQTSLYYDLASLTKVVFAQQAMMQAFDHGRWNLDTPVADVLTDFPNRQVRIRELLTHTSGIEWWRPFYQTVDLALSWEAKRAWLYEELKKAEFKPNGKAVYSDLGFMLLGFILEKFSGKNLLETWAGIKSDFYPRTALEFHPENTTPIALDQFAPTEDCPWRKKVLRGEVHDDNTHSFGGVSTHAGLFGSIDDMSVFGLALRAQLKGAPGAGVSQPTAQLFARRAIPHDAGDWALGYMLPAAEGASCGRHFSATSIGHTGFTGTSFWYDLERDLLVLILSNRVFHGRDNKAFLQLRPQIHDWICEAL